MGHTTFVLAKNILTWTDCIEDKRRLLCPNLILSRNGCSHQYFVESRGAWVQQWAYLGRGLRVQSPQINFFTIQMQKIYKTKNTMSCHEQTKTPSESKNSIFLWLRPWFNSNVDAIITNLFCEHAFCLASSSTQK